MHDPDETVRQSKIRTDLKLPILHPAVFFPSFRQHIFAPASSKYIFQYVHRGFTQLFGLNLLQDNVQKETIPNS